MREVSLELLLREVLSLCPDATVSEQADGNVVIVTNMGLNSKGILFPFDDEFDLTVDY